MPSFTLLAGTKKVLLVVIEIRRHKPRIILAGGRLEGAQIGAVSFSALVKGDVSQRGRSRLNDVKQVSQDGQVGLAAFSRGRPFDVRAEHEVGDSADAAKLPLQIVTGEKVCTDSFNARR
jgi:hypothetical protein